MSGGWGEIEGIGFTTVLKPITMQDKIIAAIAEKIKNLPIDDEGRYSTWFPDDLATEIAAAIAPLVAEKDLPLSELFTHMSEQHDLTLTDTELADIIHVSRCK